VPVVTEDLSVVFFAEGDRLYDGQENRFYLLVSDPSGRPVEADAVTMLDGIIYQARTAQNGLATLVHPVTGPVTGNVVVTDGAGHSTTHGVSMTVASAEAGQIRLRTDRVLYRAGDTVLLSIDVSGPIQRVFVDAIRGGQTVLTDAVS